MHLHYYTAVYKLIKCLQVRFTFGKIPNAFWTQVRIETNRTFRTFARTLSSCMTQNSCVARSSRPNCQQRWIMIYFFLLFAVRRCVFLTTTQPGTSQSSAIPADARLAPTPTVFTLLLEYWRAVFRIRRCMRESVYSGVLNSDGLAVRLAVVNHNAASAVVCQLVHGRLRSAIWCADAAVVELIWSVYETTASHGPLDSYLEVHVPVYLLRAVAARKLLLWLTNYITSQFAPHAEAISAAKPAESTPIRRVWYLTEIAVSAERLSFV